MRSAPSNGSGDSTMASSSVKIAVVAPIPSASTTTTAAVKNGRLANDRQTYGQLCNVDVYDGRAVTATQVGNTGATIHEAQVGIVAASRNTVILAGQPGELGFLVLPDSGRPLAPFPQMRILNVAFNIDLLDVYVTDPGSDLEDVVLPRFAALSPLVTSNFVNASVGMQELTVTRRAEKTAISTPILIDLANGDLLDLIIVDTADPNFVELIPYEFQPAP